MGMLAAPSAAQKQLPDVGDRDLPPAEYAAYFTKDESRIRELIMRIAKINEAYLRHSSSAISGVEQDGEVDAECADSVHELFLAVEEHSVLLAPLLYWAGYPGTLEDEDNRKICTRLANAAMAHKEAIMSSAATRPLLDYARDVYGVVSF